MELTNYLSNDGALLFMGIFVVIAIAYFLFIPTCVALVAKKKGRHGLVWFLLSIFINPIIALLLLIALGDKEKK
ncbi:MAG: hypothetical protein IKS53_02470 [Bacteroidales bacterium]|nr:hypothetical protein [Bacteroidales bacterium]